MHLIRPPLLISNVWRILLICSKFVAIIFWGLNQQPCKISSSIVSIHHSCSNGFFVFRWQFGHIYKQPWRCTQSISSSKSTQSLRDMFCNNHAMVACHLWGIKKIFSGIYIILPLEYQFTLEKKFCHPQKKFML